MRNITFESHEIRNRVVAELTGPATPVQQTPTGWQQVQRTWRNSYTEWQGAPTWEVDIPIVFQDRRQRSQERVISAMEKFGDLVPNLWPNRTPILSFDAKGSVAHDITRSPHKRWIVANLDWSGQQMSNSQHNRFFQECVVTLWEYIPDKIVSIRELIPTGHVPKTYLIRQGDTLQKIAARYYGDQAKWSVIAQLNQLRDPNYLRVGTVIKLPQSVVATSKATPFQSADSNFAA